MESFVATELCGLRNDWRAAWCDSPTTTIIAFGRIVARPTWVVPLVGATVLALAFTGIALLVTLWPCWLSVAAIVAGAMFANVGI